MCSSSQLKMPTGVGLQLRSDVFNIMPRCACATMNCHCNYRWWNGAFLSTIGCSSSLYEGAGRTELDYDFEETRESSKESRRFRRRKSPDITSATSAAIARRWHCPQPLENRSHNREREEFPRRSKGIRNFRRLSLDVRWRQANSESLARLD